MPLRLFYSYCHVDELLREEMQKAISVLKTNGLISEWYDRKIIPGNKWKESIIKELEVSEIVVFLISPDFLSSEACKEEWFLAKEMAQSKNKQLVSVILRDCAWTDFDNMAEYQALPKDGQAIQSWDNKDKAWLNVYNGLKNAIEDYNSNVQLNPQFLKNISKLEFCSQADGNIDIRDLFVFPNVTKEVEELEKVNTIKSYSEILALKRTLLIGEEQSGKSKLCVHVFLNSIEDRSAVMFLDLLDILHKKPSFDVYEQIFKTQYSCDFRRWLTLKNKVLIIDNLINHRNLSLHLKFLDEYFDDILIAVSRGIYDAFFIDDERFLSFKKIEIKTLTLAMQEKLIRKWLALNRNDESIYDGNIDEIENNINEIIINNRILPRFPFFILSILQTHEAFMPKDIKITAYGHCYYALILANLIKSGVDKRDDAITSCMNFCSHLAFYIYKNGVNETISIKKFNDFKSEYKVNYIIEESNINRIISEKGLVKNCNGDGFAFNLKYSHYFFLGQYLAKNYKQNSDLINSLVSHSYRRNNAIILIFTIHHSSNMELVEDILTHTVCALDKYEPAKLDKSETEVLLDLMKSVPRKILSKNSVSEEREKERQRLSEHQEITQEHEISNETEIQEEISQIYLAHKNIEILSQILKNKYGELNKKEVKEIVEVICDAGLRMVKVPLVDEEELTEIVHYIYKLTKEPGNKKIENKDELLSKIKKSVIVKLFIWTIGNVEKIVSAINKREIKELIEELRDERSTPAYDLIHYFYSLDSSYRFDKSKQELLTEILAKYDEKEMFFMHKILSIRTQYYFNTHHVHEPIKQAVSSLMKLDYKPG